MEQFNLNPLLVKLTVACHFPVTDELINNIKKYITFALLLLVNTAFAQSEKYYVTFVKGQANIKKTNKPVKVGDILLATDGVIFKDKTGKIIASKKQTVGFAKRFQTARKVHPGSSDSAAALGVSSKREEHRSTDYGHQAPDFPDDGDDEYS